MHMRDPILNGWKEISSHLSRGVRTAQRWERQFGMPVHRPASKHRTAVVAFPDELDVWLMKNRSKLLCITQGRVDESDPAYLRETLLRLQTEAKELSAKLLGLERHFREIAVFDDESRPEDTPPKFGTYN
jgi:hypothetical protein